MGHLLDEHDKCRIRSEENTGEIVKQRRTLGASAGRLSLFQLFNGQANVEVEYQAVLPCSVH